MAKRVQLRGEMTWSNSRLRRGLKEGEGLMRGTANRVGAILAGIGGIVAGGGLLVGLRKAADQFDRIGKLADQFRLSTDFLQKLGLATELTGGSLEMAAKAMRTLSVNTQEAARNVATYKREFDALGIDVRQFQRLSPEDQFRAIADSVRGASDQSKAYVAVARLMGSRQAELINLLREGSEGFDRMTDKLKVIDESGVRAIERLNDAMTRLKTGGIAVLGEQLEGLVEALEFIGVLEKKVSRAGGAKTLGNPAERAFAGRDLIMAERARERAATASRAEIAALSAMLAGRVAGGLGTGGRDRLSVGFPRSRAVEFADPEGFASFQQRRRNFNPGSINPLIGMAINAAMTADRRPGVFGAKFHRLDALEALQGGGGSGGAGGAVRIVTEEAREAKSMRQRMADALEEIETSNRIIADKFAEL